jgi:Zn finger protein HypA/HybF involved in hydrogenase expression
MLESKEPINNQRKKKPFFKYCLKCDKRFQPKGSATTICDKCRKKAYKDRKTDINRNI